MTDRETAYHTHEGSESTLLQPEGKVYSPIKGTLWHVSLQPSSPTGGVPMAPWGIHWQQPASAISLFVIGLACAIGHHVFYTLKNGKVAEHQVWTIRTGTGLAYLLGYSLASLVGISRDQWVWHTLRTRFLTLRGIDAMFGATSNLFYFFNSDLLLRAKVSTVMAAMKWLFPLSTILTPSTISVVQRLNTTEFGCTVPTLNFTYTPLIDVTDGTFKLNTLNLTTRKYISPTAQARKIFTIPAYSGRSIPGNDTEPFGLTWEEDCSVSCNYSVEFTAPAINCTEIDPTSLPRYPWGFSSKCDLAMKGRTSLAAMPVFISNRYSGRTSFWAMGTPAGKPDDYAACRKQTGFICRAAVAKYSVTQVISAGQFIEPIINSVDILYNLRTNRTSVKEHVANEPNWALFDTVVDMLRGSWVRNFTLDLTESDWSGFGGYRVNDTLISATSLVGKKGNLPQNLGKGIEIMTQKMVVSLLSDPNLIYADTTPANCSSSKMQNVYHYRPLTLVLTYSVAICVSSFIAVLGVIALMRNGVASDTSFSTILRTTRNPTLDQELAGGCLGGSPLPEKLGKLKLRFGELPADMDSGVRPPGMGAYMETDEVKHVGIGVEGRDLVSLIKKGGKYS